MEILVAMMILALSLTVVFQLFSGSLRSGHLSKNYLKAVYNAKAKMEEALLVDPEKVSELQLQGELPDGYTWTTIVEPVEELTANDTPGRTLFKASVSVGWKEGEKQKSFTVHSLLLGPVVQKTTALK